MREHEDWRGENGDGQQSRNRSAREFRDHERDYSRGKTDVQHYSDRSDRSDDIGPRQDSYRFKSERSSGSRYRTTEDDSPSYPPRTLDEGRYESGSSPYRNREFSWRDGEGTWERMQEGPSSRWSGNATGGGRMFGPGQEYGEGMGYRDSPVGLNRHALGRYGGPPSSGVNQGNYSSGYSSISDFGAGSMHGGWQGGVQQGTDFRGKGPKYQRRKEAIEEEIIKRLTESPGVNAEEIELEVSDEGGVTLKGKVSTRSEKRLAEDLTEDVWGVTNVKNEIQIGSQNANSESHGRTKSSGTAQSKASSQR